MTATFYRVASIFGEDFFHRFILLSSTSIVSESCSFWFGCYSCDLGQTLLWSETDFIRFSY